MNLSPTISPAEKTQGLNLASLSPVTNALIESGYEVSAHGNALKGYKGKTLKNRPYVVGNGHHHFDLRFTPNKDTATLDLHIWQSTPKGLEQHRDIVKESFTAAINILAEAIVNHLPVLDERLHHFDIEAFQSALKPAPKK